MTWQDILKSRNLSMLLYDFLNYMVDKEELVNRLVGAPFRDKDQVEEWFEGNFDNLDRGFLGKLRMYLDSPYDDSDFSPIEIYTKINPNASDEEAANFFKEVYNTGKVDKGSEKIIFEILDKISKSITKESIDIFTGRNYLGY
tara:strand:+ start:2718 stop:3146 length:429 start_codon:yes stop_codon:yes gene_type:complete